MTTHLDRSLTYLFVDGSCLSNRATAWAVFRVSFSSPHQYVSQQACGYLGQSSSLIAEIVAAIQALRWCTPDQHYCLVSDNQAVINALKTTKTGKASGTLQHQYWLKRLREEWVVCQAQGVKVHARWIKAHQPLSALPPSHTPEQVLRWGNHHADQLAASTARAAGYARELDELLLAEPTASHEALA